MNSSKSLFCVFLLCSTFLVVGCSDETQDAQERLNIATASISAEGQEPQPPESAPQRETSRNQQSAEPANAHPRRAGVATGDSEEARARSEEREVVEETENVRSEVPEERAEPDNAVTREEVEDPESEPETESRAAETPRSLEPELLATTGLHLSRIVMARGIEEREPIDSGTRFSVSSSEERIYAYIEVANPDSAEDELEVRWIRADSPDDVISSVQVNVGPHPRWRTWAYTSLIRQPGSYMAIVADSEGRLIARAPFEVVAD